MNPQEREQKIIELLKNNAELNLHEISRRTNINVTSVFFIISQLEREKKVQCNYKIIDGRAHKLVKLID